ncbi:hypothetical protein [Parafrankia sp. FMc2]|uniref:hypothetical protein n=1 Tax=Parafrankia sp. FMc2 TaxID=3233196 RepID=UPI0034D5070E
MTIEPHVQSDDQLQADLAWLRDIQDTPGMLEMFVAGHAPRMFALVEQDVGLLEDAVFGWGLQFDDHAFVVVRGGTSSMSCSSADDAAAILAVAGRNLRLVWHTPRADSTPGRMLRRRRVIR